MLSLEGKGMCYDIQVYRIEAIIQCLLIHFDIDSFDVHIRIRVNH